MTEETTVNIRWRTWTHREVSRASVLHDVLYDWVRPLVCLRIKEMINSVTSACMPSLKLCRWWRSCQLFLVLCCFSCGIVHVDVPDLREETVVKQHAKGSALEQEQKQRYGIQLRHCVHGCAPPAPPAPLAPAPAPAPASPPASPGSPAPSLQ